MKIVEGNVPITLASNVLGIGGASIKGGLISGALPIGSAWKNPESSSWVYHISPQKLAEYEGYSKEEILALMREGVDA